jgi:hypothetical protein
MTDERDERSTTAPDTAPQFETRDAAPGDRPAIKGEREHGPHDETKPWTDDNAKPNPRPVPGTEEAREA